MQTASLRFTTRQALGTSLLNSSANSLLPTLRPAVGRPGGSGRLICWKDQHRHGRESGEKNADTGKMFLKMGAQGAKRLPIPGGAKVDHHQLWRSNSPTPAAGGGMDAMGGGEKQVRARPPGTRRPRRSRASGPAMSLRCDDIRPGSRCSFHLLR